jgi:hemerythrin-like domain-containing protein
MDMNSPTEMLEAEHRVIAKVIGAVPVLADRLDAGQAVDVDLLRALVEFMRTYADQCHHGKEEELLFPALGKRGVPLQGCPVGALTAEHARGRTLVNDLADAIDAHQNGDSGGRQTVIDALRGIAALYPNHIWKEDYLLFPMSNKVLNAEEQQLLSGEFEKVDERIGLGQHQRLEAFAQHMAELTSTVNGDH